MSSDVIDRVVALAKRRGFIYPDSEIYGGFANAWDYGPYGVLLKNNVKQAWWESMVKSRMDIVGLDSAILMNPKVWEASGHLKEFSDPLVDCKKCKGRFRFPDDFKDSLHTNIPSTKRGATEKQAETGRGIVWQGEYLCPSCGAPIDNPVPRMFNLMFKTFAGPVEDDANTVYLRPETAQGIFTNFKNVLDSTRVKLPFGIAQIGKSFRNEITPGNFTFRTREFEQFELEYFVYPKDAEKEFERWREARLNWYIGLGIDKKNLKLKDHPKTDLAHYAKAVSDVEYNFPFGWSELEGIANRGDYDLTQHQKASGQNLEYTDDEGKKVTPWVIEPSGGVDRAVLAFLCDAYDEDKAEGETRVVLRLNPKLAPIRAAILPLVKKEPVQEVARLLYETLRQQFYVEYDESGTVGKRYRRQDEIGTPYCITVDFDGLEDETVTIRHRDTMKQERVKIADVAELIK